MKKKFSKVLAVFILFLVFGVVFTNLASAEEQEETSENQTIGTSISISPVSKVFQLSAGSTYDAVLSVANDGSEPITFEVYATPYSYVYSEENDTYSLGFSKENNYTQISRWITVLDINGNYVERATFVAGAGETVDVSYRITTPDSIPDGGQYAVLFAHTIANSTNAGGIKTEASPGMVIYGRSDGRAIISSEISDLKIAQTIEKEADAEEDGQPVRKNTVFNHINASAKVKNNGNLDFNASGVLKVEGIFGGVYYETPENAAKTSVIPETELVISDEWEETPDFGIFRATWTVVAGDKTESVGMMIFLISPTAIILSIILLTIVITWVIIELRNRKDRRSRLAV